MPSKNSVRATAVLGIALGVLSIVLVVEVWTINTPSDAADDTDDDHVDVDAYVLDMQAGSAHVCALVDNPLDMRCWGDQDYGQLGTGKKGDIYDEKNDELRSVNLGGRGNTTESTLLPMNLSFSSSVSDHTCVLVNDSSVRCWGRNHKGQLGEGSTTHRGRLKSDMGDARHAVNLGTNETHSVLMVATGGSHSCAVSYVAGDTRSRLRCWGQNNEGQLGYRDTENRGDEPHEMGDALTSVGVGKTVLDIALGGAFSCARLPSNSAGAAIKCWGDNNDGQLGQGNERSYGDDDDEKVKDLSAIELGSGFEPAAMCAGQKHACALSVNGTVKCWGENGEGQLGYGDVNDRGNAAGEMGDNLPTVNLGTGRTASQVICGGSHTCVVMDNARMKCWGSNSNGQLGQETDDIALGDEAGEMGRLGPISLGTEDGAPLEVSRGFAGKKFSCALLTNNEVKCWGTNGRGQLGYGDEKTRGIGPNSMGNDLGSVDTGVEGFLVKEESGSSDNFNTRLFGQVMVIIVSCLVIVSCVALLGLANVMPETDTGPAQGQRSAADTVAAGRLPQGHQPHQEMVTFDHIAGIHGGGSRPAPAGPTVESSAPKVSAIPVAQAVAAPVMVEATAAPPAAVATVYTETTL